MVSKVPKAGVVSIPKPTGFRVAYNGALIPIETGSLPPLVASRGIRTTNRTSAGAAAIPAPGQTPPYNPEANIGTEITIYRSPWDKPLNEQLRDFFADVERWAEGIFGNPLPPEAQRDRERNQTKSMTVTPPAAEKKAETYTGKKYAYAVGSKDQSNIVDMFGAVMKASDTKEPDGYTDTGTVSGKEPASASSENPRDIGDEIASTIEAARGSDLGSQVQGAFMVALAILLILIGLYFSRGGSVTRIVQAAQEGAAK